MPLLPSSALSKAIKGLPDSWQMQHAGVRNALKKKGVKDEELLYSGMDAALDRVDPAKLQGAAKPITKADLVYAETNRSDSWGEVNDSDAYEALALPQQDAKQLDNYQVSIRTFNEYDNTAPRRVQSHFIDKTGEYLFHTRTSDFTLPTGEKTRMIHELQSDLHQQARLAREQKIDRIVLSDPRVTKLTENYTDKYDLLIAKGKHVSKPEELEELKLAYDKELDKLAKDIGKEVPEDAGYSPKAGALPKSPLKGNWYNKAIEQEAIRAYSLGHDSISVPLEGTASNLARSKGSQKWYETTVRDSMKKLAKRIGGEYTETVTETKRVKPKNIPETERFVEQLSEDEYGTLTEHLANTIANLDLHNAQRVRWAVLYLVLNDYDKTVGLLGLNSKSKQIIGTVKLPNSSTPKYASDTDVELIQPEWMKKLELYSAGGIGLNEVANEQPILDRLEAGTPAVDIQTELTAKYAGDEVAAKQEMTASVEPFIRELMESGEFSEDAVRSLIAEELKLPEDIIMDSFADIPVQIPELQPVANEVDLSEQTTQSLYGLSHNAHQKYIPMFGEMLAPYINLNKGTARDYRKVNTDISVNVANSLRQLGRNVNIELDDSGIMSIMETKKDGTKEELDDEFWASLANSKTEIGLGIAGGAIGYKLADAIAQPLSSYGVPGKLLQAAVKGTGLVLGSSAGSAGGRGIDAAYSAYQTKQQLDTQHYKEIMVDAGVFSGTMEIIGTPIVWLGARGVRILGESFAKVASGNKAGAYKALKDSLHLEDSQVDEIIASWEKATGEKAPGMTRATKAMHVLPQTEPGAETIVQGSARRSPRMSIELTRAISDRSKNLQAAAKNMTSDNVATIVTDDLVKYKQGVKDYYTGIKQLAVDSMEDSTYKFDYDKLAIEPLLDDVKKHITNDKVFGRFETMLIRVRELGGIPGEVPSELRSFGNLIELRKVVNGFKYNSKITSALDYGSVNKVIRNLDDEIANVAQKEMPDGKLWLTEWKRANTEYSKMLQLNENVLYKALSKPGVDYKKIVKSLAGQITALDGTFLKVVAKLPPATRMKVEGAVLDNLITKHTQGAASGLQATHFPNLAADLKHISFTQPKSRELKRAISQLAEVFKNDQALANSTGKISKTGFNTALTADPRAKAKYELATGLFDYVRRVMPTEKADYLALEMHVAKILKEPKNSKSIQALIKLLEDDPAMQSKIRQYAIQMTKFGEPDKYPNVQAYRSGVPGAAHKAKTGKLGKGIYWTTEELKAKSRVAKTGGKLYKEDILPSRIATQADVENVYGGKGVTPEMLKDPKLAKALKDMGYDGLSIDDEIVVFQ